MAMKVLTKIEVQGRVRGHGMSGVLLVNQESGEADVCWDSDAL